MNAATSGTSLTLRPRPILFAMVLLGQSLQIPIFLKAAEDTAPSTRPIVLLISLSLCLAMMVATAFFWVRCRLDITSEGIRLVGWNTQFIALDDLQKVKVKKKAGDRLLNFYAKGSPSPQFTFQSTLYGPDSIARIAECLEEHGIEVKMGNHD
ncbi:hypothetical protein D3C86_1206410 [compost metagenome]